MGICEEFQIQPPHPKAQGAVGRASRTALHSELSKPSPAQTAQQSQLGYLSKLSWSSGIIPSSGKSSPKVGDFDEQGALGAQLSLV